MILDHAQIEAAGVATLLEAVRRHGADLVAYRALGDIRASLHPSGEYLLFNYTPRAQYAGRWNPVERVSRGLVVHLPTGTIAARPWAKFFNLGERPETEPGALPPGPVEVTAKVDGSYGILLRTPRGPEIVTRGSFTSSQACWATTHLLTNHPLDGLPEELTLLFEIVYPDNRVVLHYGDEEVLYLIGARTLDGYDLLHRELAPIAARYGFPLVPHVDVTDWRELLSLAATETSIEGWVLRWEDGFRVKVKTVEYHELHKLVTGFSAARVRDAMLTGSLEAYIEAMPEEFARDARLIAAELEAAVAARERPLVLMFQEVWEAAGGGSAPPERKAFALAAKARVPAEDLRYMFALLDGKEIRTDILKRLSLEEEPSDGG